MEMKSIKTKILLYNEFVTLADNVFKTVKI